MVAASSVEDVKPHHLNRGIYDVVEVATLTRQPRSRIERWVSHIDALHGFPEFEGAFSFLDLISILTASELRRRGVSESEIIQGKVYLTETLMTSWPFAHEQLATVGRQFFAAISSDDWIDVGLGGQLAIEDMIVDEIRPIEYGQDDLAAKWRPSAHVLVDPRIQAGAPCVGGTRVTTSLIQELMESGQPIEQLADDYSLTLDQVAAALAFEHSLTK